MIRVESTIGALVELRFAGSISLDEVTAFMRDTATLVKRAVKHEKRRAVICTDLRSCGILAPEVSEKILTFMRFDAPNVERNAFLGNESALVTLQLQRVISEAGERSRRRMFKQARPLIDWLGEVATEVELARARAFLSDVPHVRDRGGLADEPIDE